MTKRSSTKKPATKKKAAKAKRSASKKRASKKVPKKARPTTRTAAKGVDVADIRRVALALPGVEEGTSYGTPAFRVKKKLFLRLHQGGEDLVVRLDDDLCEMLMATEPDVSHKTPHYEGHPFVLARLAALTAPRLAALVDEAWVLSAPPRFVESRRD